MSKAGWKYSGRSGAAVAAVLGAAATPAAFGVNFSIDPAQDAKAISANIYGVNLDKNSPWGGRTTNATVGRVGGNRITTYNWENNASNGASDWYFNNDNFWTSSELPGQGMRPMIQAAQDRNRALILTVPMIGYVSADKLGGNAAGDVRYTANYLTTRFKQSLPTDPARGTNPFPTRPNTTDGFVYQDEFVNWVKTSWPASQTDPNKPIWFSLDNEPDIWAGTHAELRGNTTPGSYAEGPNKITYAEIIDKTVAYARAIKAVVPNAKVFGPDNYGWGGMYQLQWAPDAAGRDFPTFYLQQMKAAQQTYGVRLIDDYDFHWYPEIVVNGTRIINNTSDPAVIAARLQAPRSLWDPTFKEDSWITRDWYKAPLNLLPNLQSKINANYPGTKIAITEYNWGGSADISGGVTQADVLGIFGKYGVDVAAYWPLTSDISFAMGGVDLYRNYDGRGGTFGDTSVRATNGDTVNTSVYASLDSADPHLLKLVAINKTSSANPANISIAGSELYWWADVYQLTAASSVPQYAGRVFFGSPNAWQYMMPSLSASMLVLSDVLPGDANMDGRINPDDFALFDRGLAKHLTGWSNGDFTGDGLINSSDYAVLLRGFAMQEAGFALLPEPGMAAVGLLGTAFLRRPRRI